MKADPEIKPLEGPFDVLLRLIIQNELDIYQLNLTKLVDDFLLEIRNLGRLDLESLSEFLLVLSILIEIKSRKLLPNYKQEVIDLNVYDQRDLLLSRLVELKTFQEASKFMEGRLEKMRTLLLRDNINDERLKNIFPDILKNVSIDDFGLAIANLEILKEVPPLDVSHIIPETSISVEEAINDIKLRFREIKTMTFDELIEDVSKLSEKVVYFLSILELYKQGLIELYQQKTMGRIELTKTNALSV